MDGNGGVFLTDNRSFKRNMVCGDWVLQREIGRGAYGVVYSATGLHGKMAAVKCCIREELSPECYERELRGVKLYRTIPAGEGLVRLFELCECDWGVYAAIELADDEFDSYLGVSSEYYPKTLARVIAGEKALTLEAVLQIGISLCAGLVTLQRHHLLHRDIKPSNVIYVHGHPVLADFGLLAEEKESPITVGTPSYTPPENFINASGDVYGLGLTLMVASFGRPVEKLAMGPALEADTENPLFPIWWRILNKATHPDTFRRYQSAKAMLKDLRSLRRKMILFPFIQRMPSILLFVFGAIIVFLSVIILKGLSR